MSADDRSRKPKFFHLDDARIAPPASEEISEPIDGQDAFELSSKKDASDTGLARAWIERSRGIGWGAIFLSALGGLMSIGLGIWLTSFITDLFARGGWLGTLALGLALIAAFAALVLAAREITGFFRLARVAAIRLSAEDALVNADKNGQARHLTSSGGSLQTGKS